ncbi:MAG: hypothetical protein AABX34_07375 [Nanoarchaeota archaeon]
MEATVSIFDSRVYGGLKYKPLYGPDQTELIKRVFNLPVNIVIGNSEQSLFEYSFASLFSQLANETIKASGMPEIIGKPRLLVVGSGVQKGGVELEENTWSFGSPYRNLLTRFLTSYQSDVNVRSLDANLRPELPFYFHTLDQRVDTNGYYSYADDNGKLENWGNLERALEEAAIQEPEIKKYLSLETGTISEPIVHIQGSNRQFVPEYEPRSNRFTKDYFMITQMDSLNPKAQGLGRKNAVVAGCHDLGTLYAMAVLFDRELMERISKEVNLSPRFQVIGSATAYNEFSIQEVIKF